MRARTIATSIRLFAILIVVAVAAPSAAVAQQVGSADAAVIKTYVLTMPKFELWIRTTLEMAKARVDTAAMMDNDSTDKSLDAMARRIESVPVARNVLRSAGISAREYTVLSLAVLQASMTDAMMQQYPDMKEPDINHANVVFMREHRARVQELMAKLEAAGRDKGKE